MSVCLVIPDTALRTFCKEELGITDLTDVFMELSPDQVAAFTALVDATSSFGERHGAGGVEEDLAYQQLILYAVFVRGKEFFVYRRGGVGSNYSEQRLAAKWSIGIGGHVDAEDGSLLASLQREIDEEVSFTREGIAVTFGDLGVPIQISGLIKNESDAVNAVHVGLFVVVQVPDNVDVRIAEADKNEAGSFIQLDAFAALLGEQGVPEAWTKQVMQSHVFQSLTR